MPTSPHQDKRIGYNKCHFNAKMTINSNTTNMSFSKEMTKSD